ncbi:MAG: hypothetical protein EG822_02035 [Deltaproteobacteria bacterium]|nr:hypothetical protein [Deltaproteobacteria bacterium]TLN00449.1 MAG: hypothetical protein FDZ73_19445 [bacterium]
MEIDHKPNPYDPWKRPNRRRIGEFLSGLTRLMRLWLVTAVVYLVMLVVAGFFLMPNRGQVERALVFAVTEEVRKYDGLAFVAESPRRIYAAARRKGLDHWIAEVRQKHRIGSEADPAFARMWEKHLSDLRGLGDRQMKLLILLAMAWAGPMAALFAAVRVMEWINRGRRY